MQSFSLKPHRKELGLERFLPASNNAEEQQAKQVNKYEDVAIGDDGSQNNNKDFITQYFTGISFPLQ